MVIDETLYEFNGECPVRRFIPRKPHQNGLLTYALASYVNCGTKKLPIVLDFEPYVTGNPITAQEAMIRLYGRLRARSPQKVSHLVVDSAFGSFDKLMELDGTATMSMSAAVRPWLWELLDWDCGIDEGRMAFDVKSNIVVSSFKVESEAGATRQIKMISNGCKVERLDEEEETVLSVTDRREVKGKIEYKTLFADGHEEWLLAKQFIDDDGSVTSAWLGFVSKDDLKLAFRSFTKSKLKVSYLFPRAQVS